MMEMGIVGLLRAAWVAGILPLLVASLPSRRLGWFHDVVLGFAKRGKIMQSSSSKLTVPQQFFSHFYVLAATWTGFLLASTWTYAYKVAPLASEPFLHSPIVSGSRPFTLHGSRSTSPKHRSMVWKSVFLLLLMEIQVLRRLYENLYVFNYSPSARMHIFGYLTGLFNFAVELYKFLAGQVSEFIVKGKDQMTQPQFDLWELVNPIMKLGWYQWVGATIFLWGWIHQHRCHRILGSVRKHQKGNHEYLVAHGDWFNIVSSPHYLAEMVIYGGLLVASGGSDLTIWLLFGFVVTNLALAAAETHRWYRSKFKNYPRNRYAVIPFI